MCMVFDDEGPDPGPSNRISTNDWDEELHTTLGMCAANLKRMSPGPAMMHPFALKPKK